jgi:hypothetical protein
MPRHRSASTLTLQPAPAGTQRSEKRAPRRARKGNSHTKLSRNELEQMLVGSAYGRRKP